MATKHAKFLALAAVLAGCGDIARDAAPPTDRFRYPVGLALRHLQAGCTAAPCTCAAGAPGCQTVLHVVSSNFDLSYDTNEGGTLIAVRVPEPSERPATLGPRDAWDLTDIVPYRVGAARIGSFGGEVSLLDEEHCPGWESGIAPEGPVAFVASRSRDRLYRLALGVDGSVSCGADCRIDLDPDLRDPYGVTAACGGSGSGFAASVYVTYLSTPLNIGFLSELALKIPGRLAAGKSPGLQPPINIGLDAARSAAFDPFAQRVFMTGAFSGPGYMPLRWLDLAYPPSSTNPAPPVDLATRVYGAETTGIALSSDGTRAYVGLRLYDGYTAALVGGRTQDIGGALAVIDVTPASTGGISGQLLSLVPVGVGPTEVRVIPRPGLADLVAVSCNGDGSLWLYDDASGLVPRVFGIDQASGTPILGKQPAGLAVETRADGSARLYVGSFGSHFVSVIRIDDPADPRSAWVEMRLGMAQ